MKFSLVDIPSISTASIHPPSYPLPSYPSHFVPSLPQVWRRSHVFLTRYFTHLKFLLVHRGLPRARRVHTTPSREMAGRDGRHDQGDAQGKQKGQREGTASSRRTSTSSVWGVGGGSGGQCPRSASPHTPGGRPPLRHASPPPLLHYPPRSLAPPRPSGCQCCSRHRGHPIHLASNTVLSKVEAVSILHS